jgi:low temperature requirement protein LtrA
MGIQVGPPPGSDETIEPARREPWFVPPRLQTLGESGRRHATWLELFFDLVFVVAIAELSHQLVLDHSVGGYLRFIALFIPVFIAWQGFSFYADRFDTDDLAFRMVIFVAMLAIAAMAVLIGDVARGHNSAAFVLAYVTLRSLLVGLYARAYRAVPQARHLIRLYGVGYAIGALIWLASLTVPTPARYVVWGVAMAFELSLPPMSLRFRRRVPTSASHVPERWALFTLIVIGESVVAVALETAGARWQLSSSAAAVIGFAVVVGCWWMYFDRQAAVVLRRSAPAVMIYSYAHLPLLMGLAAMSAGVRMLIERAGSDHLEFGAGAALLGGVMLYLVSLIATRLVTVVGPHRRGLLLKLSALLLMAALLALTVVLPPLLPAAGLALVLASLVYAERVLMSKSVMT